jgi:hypothetical protein
VSVISLGTSTTNWPIVPSPDDRWWWIWCGRWNENWQAKRKYSEKTCPSAILSTTNLTWTDLGSNPGRRGGKPATNCLSYGTAPELLVPEPSPLEVGFATARWKNYKPPSIDQIWQNWFKQQVKYYGLRSINSLIIFGIRGNCIWSQVFIHNCQLVIVAIIYTSIFIYTLFNNTASTWDFMVLNNGISNYEMERVWKEVVLA